MTVSFNRYLFWALCLLVLVLSVIPGSDSEPVMDHGDKIAHFLMYALLTLAALVPRQVFAGVARVVLFVALFGGAMELLQLSLPHRDGSWLDFFANCSGIAAVWLLVTVGVIPSSDSGTGRLASTPEG